MPCVRESVVYNRHNFKLKPGQSVLLECKGCGVAPIKKERVPVNARKRRRQRMREIWNGIDESSVPEQTESASVVEQVGQS